MIYIVIRTVASDSPCRWCIMMATARVSVRRFWFVFHGGQEMPGVKKSPATDYYNVNKHPVVNGVVHLGETWRV